MYRKKNYKINKKSAGHGTKNFEIVHTLLSHPIVFSGFIDWLIGQLGNVVMRLSLSPSLPSNAFLVLSTD